MSPVDLVRPLAVWRRGPRKGRTLTRELPVSPTEIVDLEPGCRGSRLTPGWVNWWRSLPWATPASRPARPRCVSPPHRPSTPAGAAAVAIQCRRELF